jgi:hypothetical protein
VVLAVVVVLTIQIILAVAEVLVVIENHKHLLYQAHTQQVL